MNNWLLLQIQAGTSLNIYELNLIKKNTVYKQAEQMSLLIMIQSFM